MEVYVVKMNRWGSTEKHSYVLCVKTDKNEAIQAGTDEISYRDNKYWPQVIKFKVDSKQRSTGKFVFELGMME